MKRYWDGASAVAVVADLVLVARAITTRNYEAAVAWGVVGTMVVMYWATMRRVVGRVDREGV